MGTEINTKPFLDTHLQVFPTSIHEHNPACDICCNNDHHQVLYIEILYTHNIQLKLKCHDQIICTTTLK